MYFHPLSHINLPGRNKSTQIKKAFEKNNIKNVDFEFAVTTTSMIGDDLQSKNFMRLTLDTAT